MLGHHRDDRAETVMMRLASGHSSRGMVGVALHADIPECWGIHGVHRSGFYEADPSSFKRIKQRQERTHHTRLKSRALTDIVPKNFPFERGGVQLLRPLIIFNKKRLMDTCRAKAVEWEEDSTNGEPWRTPRNAVRELFRRSKLPMALRKDSMLALLKRNHEFASSEMSVANIKLNECDVSVFDIRSGRLVVRLPNRALPENGVYSHTYKTRRRVSTAFLLRELAYPVSPQEDIAFGSMKPAVMSIYPELFDSNLSENPMHQATSFTTAGVHFQRLPWPLSSKKPTPEMERLNPDFVWQLTRQPFSNELPSFTISPPMVNQSLLPDSDSVPPNTYPMSSVSPWSPWHLWDGRYWIRILNRSTQHIVVRPLQLSDLRVIKTTIGRDRHKALRELLAAAAPEKTRWTLPAIAHVDEAQPSLSRVLALPTLGSRGHLAVEDEKGHKRVEWQIRYKKPHRGLRHDLGRDALQPLRLRTNPAYMPTWNR